MPELLLPTADMLSMRDKAMTIPVHERAASLTKDVASGFVFNYGREHILFPHPHSERKIVAIKHNHFVSADQAKLAYDAHQIFSTLFPHNFPRIYGISGVPEDKMNTSEQNNYPCVSIRERIIKAPEGQKPVYSKIHVEHFLDGLLIDPEDIFDWLPTNFIVGSDGGEYFTDIAEYPQEVIGMSADFVQVWMDLNKVYDKHTYQLRPYTNREKHKVFNALRRVENRLAKGKSIPTISRPASPIPVFSSV